MSAYRSKYVSAEQAVACVKPGDWVDYSFCLGHPRVLDRALAARKETLTNISVRGGIILEPLAIIEQDPQAEHFLWHSWHMGGYERRLSDTQRCCYMPLIYSLMPSLYRKHLHVDVAFLRVSPMDAHGYFNVSLTNSATKAIIEKARVVVLETSDSLPRIAGKQALIHISEVDYVVEGDNAPLPTLPMAAPSENDRNIAAHLIKELRDGDVIQLGIGALPNAIGEQIVHSELKHLGIHTEMLVDSYLNMFEAGRITNLSKKQHRGQSVFTFAAGSERLYDWMKDNGGLFSAPVDHVNTAAIMAKIDAMVSINTCLEIDFFGQISAESAGCRQISGSGGQIDFASGTAHSPHGRSYICLQSTYYDKKTETLHSRIVPTLASGSVVTTQRAFVADVVTEWGMAHLAGQSIWARTERLINIAHPDFRDSLIREAEKHGIWKSSNKVGTN